MAGKGMFLVGRVQGNTLMLVPADHLMQLRPSMQVRECAYGSVRVGRVMGQAGSGCCCAGCKLLVAASGANDDGAAGRI